MAALEICHKGIMPKTIGAQFVAVWVYNGVIFAETYKVIDSGLQVFDSHTDDWEHCGYAYFQEEVGNVTDLRIITLPMLH